ncbi:hypothetical protein ACJMK2_008204 [Sinanodonta woodiana]|uniref:G-protein coupled receptors family 1 profile domain-containing protein n=1 Tax=Sinanodonta woodiana TaxID=1069815 RepID=A0ABD3VMF9_SINWO
MNDTNQTSEADTKVRGVAGGKSQAYANLESYAYWYWEVHPYLSLIVCTFGIATNIVNIVILTRKKMLSSINTILTGIAISDIVTMMEYLPYALHFYILTDIDDLTKRHTFGWSTYLVVHSCLSNTTHTISIWLGVCMAIVRYIFIRSKGNSRWNLDIYKACILVAVVYLLSVVVFIPNYMTTEVQPSFHEASNTTIYRIKNLEIYLKNTSILNAVNVWIFITVGKIVPCCLITIFGGLLLRTLQESRKLAENLKGSSFTERIQQHKRTTSMLLAIIAMFILAELPSGILAVVSVFVEDFFMSYYLLVADTLDIVSLLNNAVNFVMYCSMSRQFRECLCEMILNMCNKKARTRDYRAVSNKTTQISAV